MYCTHHIKSLVYKQYQYTNSVSTMYDFLKMENKMMKKMEKKNQQQLQKQYQ